MRRYCWLLAFLTTTSLSHSAFADFRGLILQLSDSDTYTEADKELLFLYCPVAIRANTELIRREINPYKNLSEIERYRKIDKFDEYEDLWRNKQRSVRGSDYPAFMVDIEEIARREIFREYLDGYESGEAIYRVILINDTGLCVEIVK